MLGGHRSVELPYRLVVEPPTTAEVRALLRSRAGRVYALHVLAFVVAALAWYVTGPSRAGAVGLDETSPVMVTTRPSGAAVWIDGRERGRTPAALVLAPGA